MTDVRQLWGPPATRTPSSCSVPSQVGGHLFEALRTHLEPVVIEPWYFCVDAVPKDLRIVGSVDTDHWTFGNGDGASEHPVYGLISESIPSNNDPFCILKSRSEPSVRPVEWLCLDGPDLLVSEDDHRVR